MIDSLLHPLFDINPALSIADMILHGVVEQNPPETASKFLQYSLPRIIAEITRSIRRKASSEPFSAQQDKR